MKRILCAAAALAVGTGLASAAEVVPPEQVAYDEYGGIETPLTTAAPDLDNGKALMNKGAGNCIACHQVTALDELPFHGEIGPSLDGVADRWSEADLRGLVANAKNYFPDTMMPAFYKVEGFIRPGEGYTAKPIELPIEPLLTAQEIEDLVAFLKTLKEG